ncbi:MAG: glycoside hydrolase family protein [Streptosporangiaceae bacterium]|jgi:hypothetical protein
MLPRAVAGSLAPKLAAVTLAAACAAAGGFALARQQPPQPVALAAAAGSPRPLAVPPRPEIRQSRAVRRPGHQPPKVLSAKPAPVSLGRAGKAAASAKKGVGAWAFSGVRTALARSGVSWYYTWSAGHPGIASPRHVQFVPMIWGLGSVNAADLREAKRAGRILLGFNEPDMTSQSNMTVAQALSLWPQLMATGMRLGSPAVADNAATPGGWLDRFMAGAKARHYRVSFITVHWYGADFATAPAVAQLKSYLKAIYARYHRPLWLTEFALANFGAGPHFPAAARQAAFITAATTMLQHLRYVLRYAWFALPASASDGTTGLFRAGPVATTAGRAFEAVGARH